MPVRTETITRAAGPGLLDHARRRPDAPLWRAASAALAGLLVGSAGAGPVGWWMTVAGLSLLALSTLQARPLSAIIAGSLAGAVALGAWQATSATGSTVTATAVAIAVSAAAGAAYGAIARMVQTWAGWPLLLPVVWLAIEASISGTVTLPRVDPAAIAAIPGEQASSIVALAAGPAVAFLLGLASCCLAAAAVGMRRWSRARTVVASLAAALASLGILVILESAVHAHDAPPSSTLSARVLAPVLLDKGNSDA
ncbi:MAG: hypothetical protein Q7V58_02365 [Actinomycetota bacterium]|nr:hypothetical protein [Actinomycetota bacterium]